MSPFQVPVVKPVWSCAGRSLKDGAVRSIQSGRRRARVSQPPRTHATNLTGQRIGFTPDLLSRASGGDLPLGLEPSRCDPGMEMVWTAKAQSLFTARNHVAGREACPVIGVEARRRARWRLRSSWQSTKPDRSIPAKRREGPLQSYCREAGGSFKAGHCRYPFLIPFTGSRAVGRLPSGRRSPAS